MLKKEYDNALRKLDEVKMQKSLSKFYLKLKEIFISIKVTR